MTVASPPVRRVALSLVGAVLALSILARGAGAQGISSSTLSRLSEAIQTQKLLDSSAARPSENRGEPAPRPPRQVIATSAVEGIGSAGTTPRGTAFTDWRSSSDIVWRHRRALDDAQSRLRDMAARTERFRSPLRDSWRAISPMRDLQTARGAQAGTMRERPLVRTLDTFRARGPAPDTSRQWEQLNRARSRMLDGMTRRDDQNFWNARQYERIQQTAERIRHDARRRYAELGEDHFHDLRHKTYEHHEKVLLGNSRGFASLPRRLSAIERPITSITRPLETAMWYRKTLADVNASVSRPSGRWTTQTNQHINHFDKRSSVRHSWPR